MRSATGPTSAPTRCFISSAALLVKVMARTSNGLTPCSRMRWAMRWVRTRVLPEPAPATMSSGPPVWVTASRWTGLSPSSRASSAGLMGTPAYWPPVTGLRSDGDRSSGRRGGAARQPQPPPARVLRRHRVRHPEPRPPGGPFRPLHQPPHRVAAVHAGSPRPARRCPRLPVAALGIDRDLGGRDHPPAPPRRGGVHDAGVGPPAPLRDGRRELPHRLRRLGVPPRPRGRRVAHPSRPVVGRRAGPARRAPRACHAATTPRAPGSPTKPTSPDPARWSPRRGGSTAS